MKTRLLCVLGLFVSAAAGAQTAPVEVPAMRYIGAEPMTAAQFQSLRANATDERLFYGLDANQFGDLRVPSQKGLHPVAILIHGGCWKAEYASLSDLSPIADALKAKGVATWNIEYRRLSQPGSGWPGTYLDVAKGVDYLRTIPAARQLDLSRVIVIGHSAGGHLAMWVAARKRLPPDSALYSKDPLRIKGVIDLAGTPDMRAFLPAEQNGCGGPVVEQLLGGKPADLPERYNQSSAANLLPLAVPQIVVWGKRDTIAPISIGEAYVAKARQAGDAAKLITFPQAGHFEIASPLETTWPDIEAAALSLLMGDHK